MMKAGYKKNLPNRRIMSEKDSLDFGSLLIRKLAMAETKKSQRVARVTKNSSAFVWETPQLHCARNNARNQDFNVRILQRVGTTSQRVNTPQKAITVRNEITKPFRGHQGDKGVLKQNYGLSSVSAVTCNALEYPSRDELNKTKPTQSLMVYSRFSGYHRDGQPYASKKNCLRRTICASPKGIFPFEEDKISEIVKIPPTQAVMKTATCSTKQHTESQNPFGPCGGWLNDFRIICEKEQTLKVVQQKPTSSFCISCPPKKEKNWLQREKNGSLMKDDRVSSITTHGGSGGDSLENLAGGNTASVLRSFQERETYSQLQRPPSELNVMRSLFSVFVIFSLWKRRDLESIMMNRLLLKAGFAHLQLHWMVSTNHNKAEKHIVLAPEAFGLKQCDLSQSSGVNVSNAIPLSLKSLSTTGDSKGLKMDQYRRASLVIKGRQRQNRRSKRTWLCKFVWTRLQSFQHQKHAMQCRIERLSLFIEDIWASFLSCKNRQVSVTSLEVQKLNPLKVSVLSSNRKEPLGYFKGCEPLKKLDWDAALLVNVESHQNIVNEHSLFFKSEQKIQEDILHDMRNLQMSYALKDGHWNRNLKILHTHVKKIQAQLKLHHNCKKHFYDEAKLRIKAIQQMCQKNFRESQWARCSIADALIALEQSMRDDFIERNGIKVTNSSLLSSSDSFSERHCRGDTCSSPKILSQSVFHNMKVWRRSAVSCLCSLYGPPNAETDHLNHTLTPNDVSKDPSGILKNSINAEPQLMNRDQCLSIKHNSEAWNRNNSRGLPLAKDNIDSTNHLVLPSRQMLVQDTAKKDNDLEGGHTPLTVSDSTKVSEGFEREFNGGGRATMYFKTLQPTRSSDKLFYTSRRKPPMSHTGRFGYRFSYRENKMILNKVCSTGQSKVSSQHSHRATRYSLGNRSHEKQYRHSFGPYHHSSTRIRKLLPLSQLYARARVYCKKALESNTSHSRDSSKKAFSEVVLQHLPHQVVESPREKSLVNRERFLHEELEKYSSQCQLGFIELYQQRQRLQTILEKLDQVKRKRRKDDASKQCQGLFSQLYRSLMACRWILNNTYLSREESAKNRLKILLELKKTCSPKQSSPLSTQGVISTYLDIQ